MVYHGIFSLFIVSKRIHVYIWMIDVISENIGKRLSQIQNYGGRENPQKCSQCKQPGHNKGSSRCPVNLSKAQSNAIAAQRKETFQMIQNQEKNNYFAKVSEKPSSQHEKKID